MKGLSEPEILAELSQTQKLIDQITDGSNNITRLFHFPYGNYTQDLYEIIEKQGYTSVLWTIDSQDWTGISAREIYNNIFAFNGLANGAIILMHTSGEHTLEALDLIIPALKKQKYKLVRVSDLSLG